VFIISADYTEKAYDDIAVSILTLQGNCEGALPIPILKRARREGEFPGGKPRSIDGRRADTISIVGDFAVRFLETDPISGRFITNSLIARRSCGKGVREIRSPPLFSEVCGHKSAVETKFAG